MWRWKPEDPFKLIKTAKPKCLLFSAGNENCASVWSFSYLSSWKMLLLDFKAANLKIENLSHGQWSKYTVYKRNVNGRLLHFTLSLYMWKQISWCNPENIKKYVSLREKEKAECTQFKKFCEYLTREIQSIAMLHPTNPFFDAISSFSFLFVWMLVHCLYGGFAISFVIPSSIVLNRKILILQNRYVVGSCSIFDYSIVVLFSLPRLEEI